MGYRWGYRPIVRDCYTRAGGPPGRVREVPVDAVVTAAVQSLPQMGIGGGLLLVVVLLLRRESSTEARHAAELARINAAHDAELTEMRTDIKQLRTEIDRLNEDLDTERSRRRRLEDELDTARRGGAT